MTDQPLTDVPFGLKFGVPKSSAAWGCRLIVDRGYVDFVWDRQGAFGDDGPRKALMAVLEERFPVGKLRERVRKGVADYEIVGDQNRIVTLYDDGDLVVLGNTNASYGYLYVRAFRRCDTYGADCPDEYRERRPGAIDPLPRYMSEEQYRGLMANYD